MLPMWRLWEESYCTVLFSADLVHSQIPGQALTDLWAYVTNTNVTNTNVTNTNVTNTNVYI